MALRIVQRQSQFHFRISTSEEQKQSCRLLPDNDLRALVYYRPSVPQPSLTSHICFGASHQRPSAAMSCEIPREGRCIADIRCGADTDTTVHHCYRARFLPIRLTKQALTSLGLFIPRYVLLLRRAYTLIPTPSFSKWWYVSASDSPSRGVWFTNL